jgi:hypothetical protein
MKRKSEFFPPFKDEGEVTASWGEARLIKYLDGKLVLKGGSKKDRMAAWEWISMFLNDAVVRWVKGFETKKAARRVPC